MTKFDFAPFEHFRFKTSDGTDCMCEIAIAEIASGGVSVTMRDVKENPGPGITYVKEFCATEVWKTRLRRYRPHNIRWFLFSIEDGLEEVHFNTWPDDALGGVFDAPQCYSMHVSQMYTVH